MLQTTLTHDRSMMLLEGLWDQLESVAGSLRISEEQPRAVQAARSRIAVYRVRLREIIAKIQHGGTLDRPAAAQRSVATTLREVAELLDSMEDDPPEDWIATLYQAQDAVLASLHDLRTLTPVRERMAAVVVA